MVKPTMVQSNIRFSLRDFSSIHKNEIDLFLVRELQPKLSLWTFWCEMTAAAQTNWKERWALRNWIFSGRANFECIWDCSCRRLEKVAWILRKIHWELFHLWFVVCVICDVCCVFVCDLPTALLVGWNRSRRLSSCHENGLDSFRMWLIKMSYFDFFLFSLLFWFDLLRM